VVVFIDSLYEAAQKISRTSCHGRCSWATCGSTRIERTRELHRGKCTRMRGADAMRVLWEEKGGSGKPNDFAKAPATGLSRRSE
ncbi:MAG: hypothetical protein ACREX0_10895, partial [Noviherbaspirillum sp.]